jgi:hypothetical protein
VWVVGAGRAPFPYLALLFARAAGAGPAAREARQQENPMKKFELVIAGDGLTAARAIKSQRESRGRGPIDLLSKDFVSREALVATAAVREVHGRSPEQADDTAGPTDDRNGRIATLLPSPPANERHSPRQAHLLYELLHFVAGHDRRMVSFDVVFGAEREDRLVERKRELARQAAGRSRVRAVAEEEHSVRLDVHNARLDAVVAAEMPHGNRCSSEFDLEAIVEDDIGRSDLDDPRRRQPTFRRRAPRVASRSRPAPDRPLALADHRHRHANERGYGFALMTFPSGFHWFPCQR